MQEKKAQNEIFFLVERLKTYFQIDTNIKLADILGVKQNTISGWIKNLRMDYALIISKCDKVNLNWLIWGEPPMLKKDLHEGTAVFSKPWCTCI